MTGTMIEMYHYFIILLLIVQTYGQLTVKLLDTALLVNEGQQFQLRVQKTGLVTTVVNVVVAVSFTRLMYFMGGGGGQECGWVVNVANIIIITELNI